MEHQGRLGTECVQAKRAAEHQRFGAVRFQMRLQVLRIQADGRADAAVDDLSMLLHMLDVRLMSFVGQAAQTADVDERVIRYWQYFLGRQAGIRFVRLSMLFGRFLCLKTKPISSCPPR